MNSVFKIAAVSIAVGVLVLACKLAAAEVSGSTALFSDALESIVNILSSGIALYALHIGAKPADDTHQYGHAKAELISAVATGAMILVAALVIFQRAGMEILHPKPLLKLVGGLGLGLVLNAFAGVFNLLWALYLQHTARRARSPALAADAQHLFSDVLTTIGVLVAMLAAGLLGWPVLDPLVALVIAGQITWMGSKTIMASISGLLDEAPPPDVTARMEEMVREHGAGAIEAHDFRMRQAGRSSFLEFHLVVPGRMSVDEAHEICDRIERAMKQELPGVVITIHVEPESKAKHEGILVR
ncbi:cation diffusion facilitator family transporter [Acidocella aminolytica]|uniref:Cation efflux protein n=1 Tax=Acidocella aminolytica 101 = DSM 11237 TaxID=1120923 RepID=A0A0D6PLR6_9PROT|nr:cation diffusion facilitator family transporter [Acidocella aminolytica]GAN82168.1 cation efflux protein [Acidocella aminolytica 101 = DSM 11237]GBQ43273.1 cation efflux system protein [Acidocella aminolytica 101 = DSM 11237]SHF55733.1 cation diffusion facilitator family transporter [Acidocella aminolytica 101 = DSM 11237]